MVFFLAECSVKCLQHPAVFSDYFCYYLLWRNYFVIDLYCGQKFAKSVSSYSHMHLINIFFNLFYSMLRVLIGKL